MVFCCYGYHTSRLLTSTDCSFFDFLFEQESLLEDGRDRRRSLTLQDGGGLHLLCGRAPSRGEVFGRGKRCVRFPCVWESSIDVVVGIVVQGGRLEEALEKLLNLEKQTRTVSR